MQVRKTIWVASLMLVLWIMLACRTLDTLALLRSTVTPSAPRATRTPKRIAQADLQTSGASPTFIVAVTDPPEEPVEPEPPTEPPQANPASAPTRRPVPQATARPPNTPVPPTPTSPYLYKIQESRCGPNVRTYIEGFVYENNVPKNGVIVRISQGPDGQPDPNDDFLTGSDPRKGYYFHNIDANAPHGGTWYLWVMDANAQQRLSEIAIVKTDPERVEDTENSSGSCQSAKVIFSTTGPCPACRTATPTRTRVPGTPGTPENPTQTPTQDLLNDS